MARLFRRNADADGAAETKPKGPHLNRPVTTDVLEIYPEIAELHYAALEGDWPAVVDYVGRCAHERDRSWVTGHLTRVDGIEKMLAKVVADDPDDLLAAALLGGRTVVAAWAIRGTGRANTVGREQFEKFFEHLERAEKILLEVLARDPGDIDAGRFRLTSGRGNQVGLSEIMRRYEQLAAHHPHSYAAQTNVLQSLCPKWYGTWAEAHTFARRCAKAAPRGAVNGALVAEVHIEHWFDLEREAQETYFKHPEVRAEVRRFAEMSVLHPDYEDHLGWADIHGAFAFCFAMTGDWLLAHEQFQRLDGCMSDFPWNYAGFAKWRFQEFWWKSERHALGLER